MWNGEKYKSEWNKFINVFENPPPATHEGGDIPNRFVEAARVSPYIAGHLLMALVFVTLLIVSAVVLL